MGAKGSDAADSHYAARSRPSEPSAPSEPAWCDTLEVRYTTDPDLIEAALPSPLVPTDDPVVRISISIGTDDDDRPYGSGRITLQARYGDRVGEYPVLVVHDREQNVFDDRERLGLPAKVAKIDSRMTGRRVEYGIVRQGLNVAHIVGQVSGQEQPTPSVRHEFGFRTHSTFDEPGVPSEDPELVYITRTIEERRAAKTDGIVRLGGSHLDPIRTFTLRRTQGVRLSQQFIDVSAQVIGSVPANDFQPYLHHRHDRPLDPRPIAKT